MSLPSLYASGSASVTLVSFRLRTLKALTRAIERVHPGNGYHYDLRAKVFRGRGRFGDTDPIPMVSILEAPIPQEVRAVRGENPHSVGPWELLIQGWAEDDEKNPTDPLHGLMAEVKSVLVKEKRLGGGHNMLGMDGRVMEMLVGQGTVRPTDEPMGEAFFWLSLTLTVVEDLEQPYA